VKSLKLVYVTIIIIALLFSATATIHGQVSSLGITTGDTFIYSYSASWGSNQTGVSQPSSVTEQLNLLYIGFAILAVDGVAVTANGSYIYDNGIGSDVATLDYGGGYVPFFIPKNLRVGDLIPNTGMDSSPKSPCYINDTLNQNRTIIHLNAVFTVEGLQNAVCNAYWDQATGVLTQVTYSYYSQTGDTLTDWSMTLKLFQTSAFPIGDMLPLPSSTPAVPEMSTVTMVAFASLMVVLAIVYKRKTS
jgi:hypothetical protein